MLLSRRVRCGWGSSSAERIAGPVFRLRPDSVLVCPHPCAWARDTALLQMNFTIRGQPTPCHESDMSTAVVEYSILDSWAMAAGL
jgi:hypothetical protein